MKIPDKFNNSLEEKPFDHCKMCNKSLLEDNTEYLIEKAYRKFPDNNGEELLFEIAICMECAIKMRSELSKESIQNINRFFAEKTMERQQQIMEQGPSYDPLNECLLSGKKMDAIQQYQIYAHCRNGELMIDRGYYMLSDDIIEQIQNLLSKKTREELERFSDENLGVPPELKHLFGKGDLIPF